MCCEPIISWSKKDLAFLFEVPELAGCMVVGDCHELSIH
jgi:predicted RNase H-like HicB family nuclease